MPATWLLVLAFAAAGCSRHRRCSELEVVLASEHAHSAKISADKLKQGVAGAYRVRGNDHDHAFLLKDEDQQKLELGGPINVMTSSASAHTHEVTVRCKE
jgi:hypothetical protein